MAYATEQLKKVLSEELASTVGKLWNTEQDQQFLEYTALKLTKHTVLFNAAETDQARAEAKFNLDMLQVTIAAYAHQKAMVAGQSVEATAKMVASLLVGLVVKLFKPQP